MASEQAIRNVEVSIEAEQGCSGSMGRAFYSNRQAGAVVLAEDKIALAAERHGEIAEIRAIGGIDLLNQRGRILNGLSREAGVLIPHRLGEGHTYGANRIVGHVTRGY